MKKLKILLGILLLIAGTLTLLVYTRGLKKQYNAAVLRADAANPAMSGKISETNIAHLPAAVKKYLRITGFIGGDKIRNFRLVWDGALRSDAKSTWMPATMIQQNFLRNYTRDFYLTAFMKGLPVSVYHSYQDQAATMQVKIVSLIPVVDLSGETLTTAETVTLFNDICLMAPGALIDRRITWKELDAKNVEATFTNGRFRIRATLQFNERGELINFVSEDRYYLTPENKLRREKWSTPVSEYTDVNGKHIASRGEAIWHLKDGAFAYGKFKLARIEYNTGPGKEP